MTEETFSVVEALIKEDPRRAYKDIEGVLGISSPTFKVKKIFFSVGVAPLVRCA